MNITFLIGNGFDLNLGLKTSYHNFLDYYYLKDMDDDNENIKYFKKIIREERDNGIDTWADAEISLGRVTGKFDDVDKFLECFEDFSIKLQEYLLLEQNKIDFNIYEENVLHNFDTISRNLYTLFDENYQPTFEEFFKNKSKNFTFINLNYTNSIEEYLELNNSNAKIIDVHNSLSEHIIIGLSNESQIENKEFLNDETFKQFILKSSCDEYFNKAKYSLARSYIYDSDLIILYGTSLGESDMHWWKYICNWLDRYDKKLIIYNFGIPPKTFKFNRHKKETQKKNEFLEFCPSDVNKQSIKKKIYCIENNIFEEIKDIFKESNDCNINNEKSNISNVS